jgi:PTS system ascorbate-specific IIA component
MIQNLLTSDFIRTQVDCADWKAAIHEGLVPLTEKQYVEKRYEEAIFESFRVHGNYMVIAPGLVLSHARPENGVNKLGMSLINLKKGVEFGHKTNDPVYLVITLAAENTTSHLDAMRELMKVLMNGERLNKLMFLKEKEEIIKVIGSSNY